MVAERPQSAISSFVRPVVSGPKTRAAVSSRPRSAIVAAASRTSAAGRAGVAPPGEGHRHRRAGEGRRRGRRRRGPPRAPRARPRRSASSPRCASPRGRRGRGPRRRCCARRGRTRPRSRTSRAARGRRGRAPPASAGRRVVAPALGLGPVAEEAPHAGVLPAVVHEHARAGARGRASDISTNCSPAPGGSDFEESGPPSGCHHATRQRAEKGISEPGQGKRISSSSSTGSDSARSTKAPARPMSIMKTSSLREGETRVTRRTKGMRSCRRTLSGGAGSRGLDRAGVIDRSHASTRAPGCQRALTRPGPCA